MGLQDFAAVRRGHGGAGDGGELRADEILAEIEQPHLRQVFAGQRQLQDRHRGGVVAEHVGRCDARRQELEHGLRRRRDLSQRGADVDALLEEDFDDAVAVERLRFDVLDVGDLSGQRALIIVDDAARHVVRQQTVVGPYDADDRNVDVGEDVGRRPQRRQDAEDRDQETRRRQMCMAAAGRFERPTRELSPA